MKIILGIITALTFFIGVMVNKMALSIGEQIYAALYYIMALISFCTLSVLFDGKLSCSCNWLRRECGLPEAKLEEEEQDAAIKENEKNDDDKRFEEDDNDEENENKEYDEEDFNEEDIDTDETQNEDGRKKFVKTIIITNRNN